MLHVGLPLALPHQLPGHLIAIQKLLDRPSWRTLGWAGVDTGTRGDQRSHGAHGWEKELAGVVVYIKI